MQSCGWMNGEYQQVGPPSQATTWLTQNTMRNQQAGTANNSCQYRILNTGVRPRQSPYFTLRNGVYSKSQISHWQTSAVPRQAVSSQQSDGGKTNSYYLTELNGNQQNSSTNMQSGNHGLQVTNGYWDATQQDFHQNYMQNGKQSIMPQDGNIVSNGQHCRVQKRLFQNVNGESTIPVSAYATTATLLPHEQVVCSSKLVSAHNRQTAHNQNCRQNSTQHGFSSSIPPPSYNTAVSQSFRNSITANSSSREPILHSMLQKTQQYSGEQNNGGEAISSINSNSYSSQSETSLYLSKTNDPPLHPATDTRQQMPSRQMMIARIADNLRKSFIASSDGRPPVNTSSTYSGKHYVNDVRMTESNQNMLPVSTVAESYNSNASQTLPLNSGQSLTKSTQSVMSRTHNSVDAPPQQSSVPNVFYVTTTGDGVGSLSDTSQLMQLHETQSPPANNRDMLEILEMLSSVKTNDSSILSSPGRTGARAVAVVQPLSQESYQVASKHTSSNTINQVGESTATNESLNNSEKLFISPVVAKNKNSPCLREGSNIYLENPNQMRSNKSSAGSTDGTFVSSSELVGHQDFTQKCANDTGSELAVNKQVDQRVVQSAQQSVTSEVPVSQHGDEDKSDNPTVPSLSSVPTVPWTAVTLTNFLQNAEKAQMKLKRNFAKVDSSSKLLSMFWDGSCKSLAQKLKSGWYKDLITDVSKFCSKHLTPDTVIMSQLKHGLGKQLNSYYVLEDNKVYSEPPYKSSWLNVNEQLDDIDKAFGFHWSLKHRLHVLESDRHSDQVGPGNSIAAQIVSEVSNKVLSQTELKPVDSGEEKQASTFESTSTQSSSPIKTESVNSSDSCYSFQIQVLPPEEAKVIFEQIQSKMTESMNTDSQTERVMNSSVEGELPEVIDGTLSESKLKNESVCTIEQVCCIDRWMEIILGSSTPYLSKCQCQNKQSHKDFTDETFDKEEMAVQKKEKLCAIRSDSKFHSMEGKNQAKGGENVTNQIMTCSQTTDFTQDNKPHSCSDKVPKSISQLSINSIQASIILINENDDEDISDPDVDCVQDQCTTLSCTSVSSDKEIKNFTSSESEVSNQMSDLKENCGQAQLTSTSVPKSTLETEEQQTHISATAALQTTFSLGGKHETVKRKQKALSSYDGFFPFLKKSKKCQPPVDVASQSLLEDVSKCRKVFVDATDGEPLASNVRTAELVLFGSAPQNKCALIGGRKRHISSPVSYGVPRPPEVLTVNLSPLRRKSSETVPLGEYSVKQRIHEKWRRGFPPTKTRRRSKLKTQKCSFACLSGVNLKKAEIGPTNTLELPVSTQMRIWNRNTKCCLSLKRRRSFSNGLKREREKTKKDVVSLKHPADQDRSNAEKESHAVMPLQEYDALGFSVLPNTFNFKDGSSERKETSDPVPVKPEGKDESHSKTFQRTIGTWCPKPEKKYCPLLSPPTPKTSSLFLAFQKKYKEMIHPPIAE